MPDITLQFTPYPIGTTVSAYQRKSELRPETIPPPGQSALKTAVTAADRSLKFLALNPGEYWAVAPIGGCLIYTAFNVHATEP